MMAAHRIFSHAIRIALPVAQCQRLFTPAGEELWVDGWRPRYLHPADGRTQEGMVFTTGQGDDFTIWSLADFDTGAGYARYLRITPASRCAIVQVRCRPQSAQETVVEVSYALTALTEAGAQWIEAFGDAAFQAMIEGWREAIEGRREQLREAVIA